METEPAGFDSDVDSGFSRARARRAVAIIAASVVATLAAGVAYTHPSLPSLRIPNAGRVAAGVLRSTYEVGAVDFVDRSDGWVAAVFSSGDFAVLHTADGGRTWSQQLSATGSPSSMLLEFFDQWNGVLATTGSVARLFRTFDGGSTWLPGASPGGPGAVQSWSFADPAYGWALAGTANGIPTLYRTRDGGESWSDLGPPVRPPDEALAVQFNDPFTGWLRTVSSGPYAYRSVDSGVTWSRILLPAPPQGWPQSGEFFVAAQPTRQNGVVATVANVAAGKGRSGSGGTILLYPPLTIGTFDGGVPVRYAYSTFTDQLSTFQAADVSHRPGNGAAPNQVELGSLDGGLTWTQVSPPFFQAAIGYYDAWDWWSVSEGAWSSSEDGGVTWTQPRSIGVPSPLPGSLDVLGRTDAWFAAAVPGRPTLESTIDGGRTWSMVLLPPAVDHPPGSMP